MLERRLDHLGQDGLQAFYPGPGQRGRGSWWRAGPGGLDDAGGLAGYGIEEVDAADGRARVLLVELRPDNRGGEVVRLAVARDAELLGSLGGVGRELVRRGCLVGELGQEAEFVLERHTDCVQVKKKTRGSSGTSRA